MDLVMRRLGPCCPDEQMGVMRSRLVDLGVVGLVRWKLRAEGNEETKTLDFSHPHSSADEPR